LVLVIFSMQSNSGDSKKSKKNNATQDLLVYKTIHPNGLIQLSDYQFRLVLEVQPINMALKSKGEQEAIWLSFRNLINSLTVPVDFLVQSRYMDLSDYINDLKSVSERAEIDKIREYGKHITSNLEERIDEKDVRDKKFYIKIYIDTDDLAAIESGIEVENELVNKSLHSLKKTAISKEDAKDLAEQELENAAEILISGLHNLGSKAEVLNKRGVLSLIYHTLNRDLAPIARLEDADNAGMMRLSPRSLTPFIAGGETNVQEKTEAEESEKA